MRASEETPGYRTTLFEKIIGYWDVGVKVFLFCIYFFTIVVPFIDACIAISNAIAMNKYRSFQRAFPPTPQQELADSDDESDSSVEIDDIILSQVVVVEDDEEIDSAEVSTVTPVVEVGDIVDAEYASHESQGDFPDPGVQVTYLQRPPQRHSIDNIYRYRLGATVASQAISWEVISQERQVDLQWNLQQYRRNFSNFRLRGTSQRSW